MTVQEILIIRNKIILSNGNILTEDQLGIFTWVELGLVYSLSHSGKVVILQVLVFLMEREVVDCTHTDLFVICLESKSI